MDKGDPRKKRAKMLALLAVGMFGFSFAMVPLYGWICKVTGVNSVATNAALQEQAEGVEIESTRLITVEFDATVNEGLAVEFKPGERRLKVHPGEKKETFFKVKNLSNQSLTLQAVPGVTPWQATEHLHKIECFCFTRQTLEAGEEVEMPLRFYVDKELPRQFQRMTLSYAIMGLEGVSDAPDLEIN